MAVSRPRTLDKARLLVDNLLAAGLAAANPRHKVAECLIADRPLPDDGASAVIAIGKAATAMALGARDLLGGRIGVGIILTKDGHAAGAPDGFAVFEAAHPVPDQRGLDATKVILETVDALGRHDDVLVLISGGGSALLELPRPPIALADLQETTTLLLRAGAPIQHLNAVRSELSQVKGGGLRRRIGTARCVTLILSDVLGNDPQVIASGPTIRRQPNPSEALQLLDQYRVMDRIPRSVFNALRGAEGGDGAEQPDIDGDVFRIVADNDVFLDAIIAEARRRGVNVRTVWRQKEGEARDLATRFVEELAKTDDDVDIIIGGGEATVTITGAGSGGRNTEFTLAAGLHLASMPGDDRWAIAGVSSDGQDGSIDAAGALTDTESIRRAAARGFDPRRALEENDSGGYFERTDELIRTGPTGTNVNDVSIAVRLARSSSR